MKEYQKKTLSLKEQVNLLESRGLTIQNRYEAESFLGNVSYYRFSAYCIPFECQRHQFRKDVTFERIVRLYRIDSFLRNTVFAVIAEIETAFRAIITHSLAAHGGAFAHLNHRDFFYPIFHYVLNDEC